MALDMSIEKAFLEIQKMSHLMKVSSPLIVFRPFQDNPLPQTMREGKTYIVSLRFLGFIPLGKHVFTIMKIDRKNRIMTTDEKGSFIRVWKHRMSLNKQKNNSILYTDEIEIKAGFLTFLVWVFTQILYRHRQRKWKKMIH